jgi:hypothetical protein
MWWDEYCGSYKMDTLEWRWLWHGNLLLYSFILHFYVFCPSQKDGRIKAKHEKRIDFGIVCSLVRIDVTSWSVVWSSWLYEDLRPRENIALLLLFTSSFCLNSPFCYHQGGAWVANSSSSSRDNNCDRRDASSLGDFCLTLRNVMPRNFTERIIFPSLPISLGRVVNMIFRCPSFRFIMWYNGLITQSHNPLPMLSDRQLCDEALRSDI